MNHHQYCRTPLLHYKLDTFLLFVFIYINILSFKTDLLNNLIIFFILIKSMNIIHLHE